MAKIMFQLTPPRPDDPSAKMSPQEWIQHQDRRSALKRQSSFEFDDDKQKKLKLDPRDKETHTSILEYYTDTQLSYEDCAEICATCPIDEFLEETRELREQQQKEIKKIPGLILQLQTRGTEFKAFKKETDGQIKALEGKDKEKLAQIKALEGKDKEKLAQIKALELKDKNMSAEMDQIKAQFAVLDANAKANDESRLTMFLANLVISLIKKVAKMRGEKLPKGDNDPEHSTNRYQRYADSLPNDDKAKAAWEKEFGLDGQYLMTLKNIRRYQEDRNNAAHETEYDFARLLLSNRYRDEPEHLYYAPLFAWVYNMSVEKAAKVKTARTRPGVDEVKGAEKFLRKLGISIDKDGIFKPKETQS